MADTHTFSSSTVLDVRFGFIRWDYDRTPGNLGIVLVSAFGLRKTSYGETSQRSGVPGMDTIPIWKWPRDLGGSTRGALSRLNNG